MKYRIVLSIQGKDDGELHYQNIDQQSLLETEDYDQVRRWGAALYDFMQSLMNFARELGS